MRAEDLVTGRREFIDDVSASGFLHGALVRLDVPRATILGIDTAAASEVPGVIRVFTAVDFQRDGRVPRFGPVVADQPVLASGQTRYQGEPVALVVGESEAVARAASDLVVVTFEELPPILDAPAALAGDLLHDPVERPQEQQEWKDSNVMGEWEFAWGSVAEGEREAAVVVDARYSAPFAHHFAIETHGAVCTPGPDGVTVKSSAQHPFILRRVLAAMLELDEEHVRVASTPMGGSFGSKGYPKVEPVVTLAALALQRPVKLVLNAEEAFATAQREASEIHARTGFTRDGRIVFQDMEADFLVGAYSDISTRVVSKAGLHALAPYRTPNARVRARGLFTSSPPTTAFRGFGAPHTIMALEGQMNHAAAMLDMDPLDVRLVNLRQRGEPSAYAEKPVDGDWPGLLQLVADTIGWREPKDPSIGRGIAFGVKTCIPATRSEARIHLTGLESAVVRVGTTEMGQGTPALLASLAARELGLDEECVRVVAGDSGSVPFDELTASSRSVVHMGNAVVAACDDLKKQLAEGSGSDERELVGEGSFESEADPDNPLGGPTPFYEAVATSVKLTVDADTGLVSIVNVVHATDAGAVLNPARAKGLDEGGIVMGLGLALSEGLVHADDGRMMNGSSLDYRIPTIGDRPLRVESLFQENADGPGPKGAKGLAEGGILAVAPAVCAAIDDCVGVYVHDLPATPEKIWTLAQGAR
jgi:CO/xanthine dehydrogenase Mo-binding subunit